MIAKKKQALDAGGLYVLGTERHESRRIDNQLRGRSGRQGDPGRSKFYLSLEDDLMRIFGSDRMDGVLQKLGLQEGEAITHPWINKALEKAQQKVEARNFDSRKYVLKYDDVMNDQRKVIFEQRIDIMGHDDVSETVADMRDAGGERAGGAVHPAQRLRRAVEHGRRSRTRCERIFGLDLPIDDWAAEEGIADQEITERLLDGDRRQGQGRRRPSSAPRRMRQIEKMVLLQTLDHLWREHLVMLEHLRSVIGFRSYGQRDPLNEYKSEGFQLFETMLANLREAVTGQLMHIQSAAGRGARICSSRSSCRRCRRTTSIPFTGEDELAMADAALAAGERPDARGGRAARAAADAASARRSLNPKDPAHLGQGRAQRGLPVRLGQEIQALPRQARLSGCVARRDAAARSR